MAKYLEVVVNRPLFQSFTYMNAKATEGESLFGRRVDITFGNCRERGFVISESDALPEPLGYDPRKIKSIRRAIDKSPVFTEETVALARWLSEYYICSLGEALSVMVPGGKRESDFCGLGFGDMDGLSVGESELSEEQRTAVDGIMGGEEGIMHYLYGPTGTGKTEVFLRAAEKALALGKGVIYLVPEIALTQQVIEAVAARFGQAAAVLHSALTPSQRLSEWNRILSGEARIVVGARSAVFAPVPKLGLIIIDEEHDGSYKSGSAPRYHARQVAMHRCISAGIPLVMGSATPSVEAWKLMDDGKIRRHVLTRRLAGGAMPEIRCIDLSKEDGRQGSISAELQSEIEATLAEKRQAILFLNRRGFSHYFRCNSCGYEMKCRNCSVSMTLHRKEKRLRCHYCGWSVPQPQKCPECGSLDIGYSGFGTEFIENEVRAKFPAARIIRLDTDSISPKELPAAIDGFRRGEWDIMLGTQMVAKGLNFPNLKLVGVVQADTGLHMPDFRAAERTFALITQVAGRAGRFFPDGKVLVQTYNPTALPIACATRGMTEQFYEEEIETREMTGFPPFSRMAQLVFRSKSEETSARMADEGGSLLGEILDSMRRAEGIPEEAKKAMEMTEILGPSECPLAKISENYRNQIILRGPSIAVIREMARRLLLGYRIPGNAYIECDIDPASVL